MKKLCLSLVILCTLSNWSLAQSHDYILQLSSGALTLEEIIRDYPIIKDQLKFDLYPPYYKDLVDYYYPEKRLNKRLSYKLTDQVIKQIKYDKPDWTNQERRKYEYNSQNTLVRITTQGWNGNSWDDTYKTEFLTVGYDSYNLTNGSWNKSSSTRYLYNQEGKNAGSVYETFGSFPTKTKSEYTYNDEGFIAKTESSRWNYNTNQYEQTGDNNYTFNSAGKQTESISRTYSNGTFVNSYKSVTEYNENGTTKKSTGYSWNSSLSSWTPGNYTEYSYFANTTNQSEAVTKNNNGVPTQRLLYTYTATNKIATNETQTWDNSAQSWNPWWKTEYTYTGDDYTASSTRNTYTPGKGYEGYDRELFEYKTEEPATKVRLTTSVFPQEAAEDGCIVTPAGSTDYTKDAKVTLDAEAGSGWAFSKWTGSLSGAIKPQELVMDDDKNVVGNFQPVLKLSLSSPNENNLCPPTENEEVTIATAGIFVDGVDWMFTGITFTAIEKFKPDYTEAWIEYAGSKLKGKINVDADSNATSYTFSPNHQISEGTTLSVKLILKFNYPSKSTEKYIPLALTEVKKYKVSINVGQITCIPIPETSRPGIKGPQEIFYSNKQTIASVWNVSKEPDLPFATIKDAVESGQTLDNELIKLCPGWYIESVEVKKSLTIFSTDGAEKTILNRPSKTDFIISLKKSKTKITGLQFANGSYSILIEDSLENITNCEIKECIIKNKMFLSQNSDSNYVHHNSFYDNLSIENSSFNRVEDNVFDKARIELGKKADDNIIKGNIIGNTTIGIQHYSYLEEVIKRNEIKNNFIGWDPNQKKLIPVEIGISLRFAEQNIIEGNTIVAEERAVGDSHEIKFEHASHNTLKNNHFGLDTTSLQTFPRRVSVSISEESNNNTFDKNYFVGNYFAALVIGTSSMDNIIKNNFFGSDKSFVDELALKHLRATGIVIYQNCHNTIIDNNTFSSIGACIGIKLSNMIEITNNKFGCDEAGTKEVLTLSGVVLNSSHNTISGNTFMSTSYSVIISDETAKSNIISNNKFGTDINGTKVGFSGAGISITNGASDNFVENNLFAGYKAFGVMLADPGTTRNIIQDNIFGLDFTHSKYLGIGNGIALYEGAHENFVLRNTVCGANTDTSCAVMIGKYSNKNIIRDNYLGTNKTGTLNIPNSYGIYAELSNCNSFIQNKIWFNKRGIYEVNCNNYIAENDIRQSTGNTGVHLINSNSKVTGNIITEDSFDAIKCERGSNPTITGNNIYNNKGFGLSNADPTVEINAQNNYWGSASGSSGFVQGNVNASTWLSSESKLILVASLDTLYLPENGIDSVSVFSRNWSNANDKLSIVITSDKPNWITSSKNFVMDLSQPNSGESKIKFSLPIGTAKGEVSKTILKATSQTDAMLSASDTLIAVVYQSSLSRIVIRPDSTSCNVGDTLQFSVAAFDQHLNSTVTPTQIHWAAEGGTISNTGKFIAGNTKGVFSITAAVANSNIKADGKIKIENIATSIEEIKEKEITTEYKLYYNYPNPFNPETKIKYDLPKTSLVVLKVYDILGREVTTLVNKEQSAGKYEVVFSSYKLNLASGVYIYRIIAGDYLCIRKMLLMK